MRRNDRALLNGMALLNGKGNTISDCLSNAKRAEQTWINHT